MFLYMSNKYYLKRSTTTAND